MTDQDKTTAISEEVVVVPLDEASMEDYPSVLDFVPAERPVVKVIDGVQDTAAHRGKVQR